MPVSQFHHVHGLSEMVQTLREIPKQTRRKIMHPAGSAAAEIVKDEAIRQAPEWHGKVSAGHPPPGTLKNSIVQHYSRANSDDQRATFVVRVLNSGVERTTARGTSGRTFDPTTGRTTSIRYKFKSVQKMGGAFYWWWVEFGSVNNQAVGFMRGALAVKAGEAIDAYGDVLRTRFKEVIYLVKK